MSEYICPHCKNPIYDEDALLCHFCGESLHRGGKGALSRMKYGSSGWFAIGVAVLVILGMIIYWIF